MLQFLHPVWLWAISGIIIPLIIHLWNIRQGKILEVGSIAFLQNSSKQYAKSFKVNEWPLLLLRCLLIISASFLLAAPIWKKSATAKEKGWVLINKQGFNDGYAAYKTAIDSLNKEGFSFHYFEEGFTSTTLADALKDTGLITAFKTINYWELIKQANKTPAGLPVYLFTDNRLIHFSGNRPAIQNNIHWYTYVPKDSTAAHIAKAYLNSDDSIQLIVSNSTAINTHFSNIILSPKNQLSGNYKINIEKGNFYVQFKNDSAILVDTSTLKITIYAAQNNNDALYLKAAISSIQNFTNRKIKLQIVKNEKNIEAEQDWVFWLNSQQVSDGITAKNIFAYADGKEENSNSWINTLAANIGGENINIFKRTVPATVSASAQIIWEDGFGNPVLSKEVNNQSNIYRFYNRFDPAWSNIVWGNGFPALLTTVILNDTPTKIIDDKRTIDEQQLQPFFKPSLTVPAQINFGGSDISNLFWIITFLVFAIERWFSFRTKKTDA